MSGLIAVVSVSPYNVNYCNCTLGLAGQPEGDWRHVSRIVGDRIGQGSSDSFIDH